MPEKLISFKAEIDRLKSQGYSNETIRRMLQIEGNDIQPSSLFIDKNFRLFLPEYDNIEIKLEPLQKVIYILYLNHPEGIRFKELSDHKGELYHLYLNIGNRTETDVIIKSVNRLVSPIDNSINEKVSKIKRSFVEAVGRDVALWYCICGIKGEPKRIMLPRHLVVEEANELNICNIGTIKSFV